MHEESQKNIGTLRIPGIFYGGILLMKKNEILLFAATWMDLEGIMLSEISQIEKDILYDITYVESKKDNK